MKRFSALVLSCVLLLCFAACRQTPAENLADAPIDTTVNISAVSALAESTVPPTTEEAVYRLPENFTLAGIALGGMTTQEAAAAVTGAIDSYTLTLQAGDQSVTVTAEDMALTLNETALTDYLSAMENGQEAVPANLAACDTAKVMEAVENQLSKSVENAAVVYHPRQQQFVVTKPEKGQRVNADGIAPDVEAAVGALATEAEVPVSVTTVRYSVSADDPRIPAALEKANSYLAIQLAYTYETDGLPATTVALSKSTIADLIHIDQDFNVTVSDSGINSYVSQMVKKYYGIATSGKFITSYGTPVNHSVQYYGASVDSTALAADIKYCLENYISGTRTAPYLPALTDKPYGGNYVEINLSAQTLWVYKDAKCVIKTPIVSGNISSKKYTTTGVYSIYSKVRDTWLVGRDFRDYVHYWIAFNGNIGIHDATWREEFGDEIYRYNGSHGCVNLPLSAASVVYSNISKGTMVICYGGTRDAGEFTQELSGTAQYTVAEDAAPFQLDTTPKYRGTEITYSSEDTDIVTVSQEGLVTVKGTGTACITVSSEAVGSMSAAAFTVQVTVTSACDEGRHTVTAWTSPTPACQSGVQTGVCDKCGQAQEQPYTPAAHDFTTGGSHCGYGCGTENPDYQSPDTTEPENTTTGDTQ